MTDTRTAPPRIPLRFANYGGDVRAELLADPVMGPNMLREAMTVVEAVYDPLTDRTRAGFSFTTTDDIDAHPPRAVHRARAATRHPAFFAHRGI